MSDAQPAATVAGQSIALHVAGYPDVPNRWGSGHIRVASIRLDYGSSVSPDARRVFVVGACVRDDGEVTDASVDRYYDAPSGDMSDWPDWIADLTRKHTPSAPADRAAVLREAADQIVQVHDRLITEPETTGKFLAGMARATAELRRLAAEAQQPTDEDVVEAHRLALSFALGLGTGAPWDAIRDRAAELHGVEAQQQPDTETPAGANTPLICSDERHATKAAALEQEVKRVRDVCDQLLRASVLADGEPHTDRERGIVQAVTRVLSALKAEHTPEEA